MTMFASRPNENGRSIKVGITYGPVSTYIEEDAGHLRGFHEQLGQLLDQIEAESKAKQDTATE